MESFKLSKGAVCISFLAMALSFLSRTFFKCVLFVVAVVSEEFVLVPDIWLASGWSTLNKLYAENAASPIVRRTNKAKAVLETPFFCDRDIFDLMFKYFVS